MRTVNLHGVLGARFGRKFELAIEDPSEAIRALCVQLPGFEAAVKEGSWHLIRGPLDASDEVPEDGLKVSLGQQKELHIVPAIEGANNGWVNVVLGVALIAVAWWNPFGWAAGGAMITGTMAAGVGLAVGGLIQMTTKMPGVDESSMGGVDERASYLFNGPTNQSKQGVAVPRGYGRLLVGSIVVSGGIFAEEYAG